MVWLATVLILGFTACSKKKNARREPPPPAPSAVPAPAPAPRTPLGTDGGYRRGGVLRVTGDRVVDEEHVYTVGGQGPIPIPRPRHPRSEIYSGDHSGDDESELFITRPGSRSDHAYEDGHRGSHSPRYSRNQECGTAYRHEHDDWYPGLPELPLEKPLRTWHIALAGRYDAEDVRRDPGLGYSFTDSRRDGLMNMIFGWIKSLSPEMDKASRDLAPRISDVFVYTDIHTTQEIQLQFELRGNSGRSVPVVLNGRFPDSNPKSRVDVPLVQQESGPSRLRFSGRLTCADKNYGCQSVVVRLHQLSPSGDVSAVAFLIHRWGPAHITISEQDQFYFDQHENPAHRRFAKYLANSVHNSCLAKLHAFAKGTRSLTKCAYERLRSECEGQPARLPAAADVGLRAWSVAYGRSAFEVEFIHNDQYGLVDRELNPSGSLVIKGPLVHSRERPMWPHKLEVFDDKRLTPPPLQFADSIGAAYLVANDGGGNLNFQIEFRGGPSSHLRLSVSPNLQDTRSTPPRRPPRDAPEPERRRGPPQK
ncbi:MAG: hypothetical protein AB7G93_15085 [Bdellovibrionales bacterium]